MIKGETGDEVMTTPKVKSAEEWKDWAWNQFRLGNYKFVDDAMVEAIRQSQEQAHAEGFQEAVEMLRAAPSISGARSSLANEYADWLEKLAKERT